MKCASYFQDIHFPNWRLLLLSIAVGFLGGAANAYQVILNSPEYLIQRFLNESTYAHYRVVLTTNDLNVLWSVLAATVDLGAMAGALITHVTMERFGRRNTCLLIIQVITGVGAFLQMLAPAVNAMELLFVGRFLTGVCISMVTGLLPIYMTECAPDHDRGFVGATTAYAVYSWNLISVILGLPDLFGTETGWPYLLGFGMIPAGLCLLLRNVMPESPKHLYIAEKSPEKATEAILYLQGPNANVGRLLREFEAEKILTEDQSDLSMKDIWSHPTTRRAFFIGIMGLLALIVTGQDTLGQYSTAVLDSVGVGNLDSERASVYIRIPEMVIALFAIPFFDKWGRRPMMLTGLAIGLVGDILITIGSMQTIPICSVVGMTTVFAINRVAITPLGHLLVAEVCPHGSRSRTAAYGLFLNWSFSFILDFTYPSFHSQIGWIGFLVFVISTAIFLLWFWRYLPETKNRPINMIVEHLGDGDDCEEFDASDKSARYTKTSADMTGEVDLLDRLKPHKYGTIP